MLGLQIDEAGELANARAPSSTRDHGRSHRAALRAARDTSIYAAFGTGDIPRSWEFLKFAPKTFVEGQTCVVALCDLEAPVRRSGRIFRELDETHIWHFDP